jgi:hypothetical protein
VALFKLGVTGTDSLHHRALLIGRALQVYKQLYVPSHLATFTVPVGFVVPSGKTAVAEGWPKELWGLMLGELTSTIRFNGRFVLSRAFYER